VFNKRLYYSSFSKNVPVYMVNMTARAPPEIFVHGIDVSYSKVSQSFESEDFEIVSRI